MNRRSCLASLVALTTGSGCIGRATDQSPSNQMNKSISISDVERRPPSEPENLGVDEKPSDIEFTVDIVREDITPETTARIALGYENASDETRTLNVNPDQPGPISSVTESPGLVLLSDTPDLSRQSSSCWKPERDTFGRVRVGYQHPISPGDVETLEYDVWAAPQQDADCIEPGTYRFEPLYGSFTLTVRE